MRKSICLLISGLFIAALLAGCVLPQQATSGTTDPTTTTGGPTIPSQPTDPTEPTVPTDPAQPAEPQEIPFTYQFIDAMCNELDDEFFEHPVLYVIRSTEQLETYTLEYERRVSGTDFTEVTDEFDGDYFEEHTLLIIYVFDYAISPQERYFVEGLIRQQENEYVLSLESFHSNLNPDAFYAWHLLIEVDGCIPEDATVSLEHTYNYTEEP